MGTVFPMMSQNGESSFVEIGVGTFGGCFGNMVGMPRKVLEVFPMMSQNGESSF